eukprot:scaffold455421_cov45-Prasinocladus_malaysianus.AAC.1
MLPVRGRYAMAVGGPTRPPGISSVGYVSGSTNFPECLKLCRLNDLPGFRVVDVPFWLSVTLQDGIVLPESGVDKYGQAVVGRQHQLVPYS